MACQSKIALEATIKDLKEELDSCQCDLAHAQETMTDQECMLSSFQRREQGLYEEIERRNLQHSQDVGNLKEEYRQIFLFLGQVIKGSISVDKLYDILSVIASEVPQVVSQAVRVAGVEMLSDLDRQIQVLKAPRPEDFPPSSYIEI